MLNFRLIRHLWLFLAVAEEQHFGRAAKKLGMTQPPLTEQIQILENALKVKLFERSRRGAQLTPMGKAILPEVRKLRDYLERLELTIHEALAGQTGVLTIGAITSAMVDMLPPLISELQTAYPQLTISVREIDTAEAIPALENGNIDIAFSRLEITNDHEINVRPLQQEQLAVALPRQHPLASTASVALADLAKETFVMFPRPLNPTYFDILMANCYNSGFTPRVLHEARSVASQVGLVGCNQGIALVPLALQKMAPENVVIRPLEGNINVTTISVAWNNRRNHPAVATVIEWLEEHHLSAQS